MSRTERLSSRPQQRRPDRTRNSETGRRAPLEGLLSVLSGPGVGMFAGKPSCQRGASYGEILRSRIVCLLFLKRLRLPASPAGPFPDQHALSGARQNRQKRRCLPPPSKWSRGQHRQNRRKSRSASPSDDRGSSCECFGVDGVDEFRSAAGFDFPGSNPMQIVEQLQT